MAVTIGVARGIQFLHSGVTPGLFGNNLKTENIFLDENLKAKISNYKLPMSHMVSSHLVLFFNHCCFIFIFFNLYEQNNSQ